MVKSKRSGKVDFFGQIGAKVPLRNPRVAGFIAVALRHAARMEKTFSGFSVRVVMSSHSGTTFKIPTGVAAEFRWGNRDVANVFLPVSSAIGLTAFYCEPAVIPLESRYVKIHNLEEWANWKKVFDDLFFRPMSWMVEEGKEQANNVGRALLNIGNEN